MTITPDTSVRDVLRRYPGARAVFETHGLLGCGGPNGPDEPLALFARAHEVDGEQLIRELHEATRGGIRAEKSPCRPAVNLRARGMSRIMYVWSSFDAFSALGML